MSNQFNPERQPAVKNTTLSPLFLRSVVKGNDAGQWPIGYVGSATPLDIYNPNKTAMLIDQIRFRVNTVEGVNPQGGGSSHQARASSSSSSSAAPPLGGPAVGVGNTLDRFGMNADMLGAVAVEILLGSIPITNNFVTLGSLAPRYVSLYPQLDIISDGGPGADNIAVYHLPTPLYVPPLVQLSIRFRRQPMWAGDTSATLIKRVDVSVVGRSLPSDFPVPGSIEIPFVTETQCNDTTLTRFVSRDNDLVNKNNVPLDVYQFVGFNVLAGQYLGFNDGWFSCSPNPTFTVQMTTSNGTMLIRDQVPFLAVFPSSKNILPAASRLQPGQFFRAELDVGVPDNVTNCAFTSIAMHGTRKIQTPGTLG